MMKVILNINKYNPHSGIILNWEENYKIEINEEHGETVISANKEGLLSLANHFANLAQDDIPVGSHIHLDQYNSLEEGSCDVIVQKI